MLFLEVGAQDEEAPQRQHQRAQHPPPAPGEEIPMQMMTTKGFRGMNSLRLSRKRQGHCK